MKDRNSVSDAVCSRSESLVIPLDALEPERVARFFHECYEILAPEYGYRTREASAKPWDEVPENNRKLMIATAAAVLQRLANSAPGGGDRPTTGVLPDIDGTWCAICPWCRTLLIRLEQSHEKVEAILDHHQRVCGP